MKVTKLTINPWRIIVSSLQAIKQNLWRVFWMTAIVSIPASAIRAYYFDSANDISILASLATLILALTLTWSFMHIDQLKKKRFTQLYVLASSRLLPYIFTSVIISVISLSCILGVFLLILTLSAQASLVISPLGIILILIGVYFLIRFSVATYVVTEEDNTTISALVQSWQLTKKIFWRVLLAWFSIFLLIVVLSSIVFTIADLITGFNLTPMWQTILNALLAIILLPVLVAYGAELTKRLQS